MSRGFYNEKVVSDAEARIAGGITAALSAQDGEAVVGVAPAGAGKSYAIGTAVAAARAKKLRIAVASPTNEQVFALLADLADRMPKEALTFVPRGGLTLPQRYRRKNINEKKAKETAKDTIVVGTLNKLGDAHARGHLGGFDLLLIDEAFQANSVHYFLVGDLAKRHLLMGDSGQLAPFSTAPDATRWRGLGEDPLLTAVEVLRRNHRQHVKEFQLPVTRRLDPRAVPVARAFYPGHPFEAAVRAGVRELTLKPGPAKRANARIDGVLDRAAASGWAHVELPATAVLVGDPETVELIVSLLSRLFARGPTARCERVPKGRALNHADVAVAVSHNEQKRLVRLALDAAGYQDVVVDTANKLQGLTFEVVFAWHPLAGLIEGDEFHLDPGRLCVMLTRHRQACIVVGREGDRQLVQGIPPATPSYVGWDASPALDGWYVHEAVFRALEPHRIAA